MAGLGGIVALLVKNAVKSAVKFELAIDPIIEKFENQCPPKAVLDQTIKQKNQLTNALTQIETSLSSLDKTGSTIDGIVTGVKIGVSILKALPIPSSVPPGVGIPLNVINGFSDTLDTLGVLLKEFGGVTSQISPSLQIITKTLATVNSKLAIATITLNFAVTPLFFKYFKKRDYKSFQNLANSLLSVLFLSFSHITICIFYTMGQ